MFFFVMTKNSNWEILTKMGLKVVSTRFLLVCFSCLTDSNCDTWENIFISLRKFFLFSRKSSFSILDIQIS